MVADLVLFYLVMIVSISLPYTREKAFHASKVFITKRSENVEPSYTLLVPKSFFSFLCSFIIILAPQDE